MTPEQCHPIYCNPQQVEGSAEWDRHSSSNLHKQQMDGQDEGSRRIYNQRGLTKKKRGQFGRHQKALVVWHQRRRRRTHPRTRPKDRLSPLLYAVGDPALPLMKSSQRPSSWARFSTKFIVLGLLGLGSLTPTVKDPPNRDPTIIYATIFLKIFIKLNTCNHLQWRFCYSYFIIYHFILWV